MTPGSYWVLVAALVPVTALLLLPSRARPLATILCLAPFASIWIFYRTGSMEALSLGGAATVLAALLLALGASRLSRRDKLLILVVGFMALLALAVPPARVILRTAAAFQDSYICLARSPTDRCPLNVQAFVGFLLTAWGTLVGLVFGFFGEMFLILALVDRAAERASLTDPS